MERHRRFLLSAFILTTAALIIHILAVSLPFWQWKDIYEYVSVNTTRITHSQVQGLWTVCDLKDGFSTCWQLSQLTAWLKGVRTLETISMILLFLAVICMTIYLTCFSRKLILDGIFIIALCICAILTLAGVILYGVHIEGSSLHVAFAFALLAAILSLLAAVLLMIMHCCGKRHINKISATESRRTVDSKWEENKEENAVMEKGSMSQSREGTPFKPICGECRRSHGTVVDRSTSMTWNGKGPHTAMQSSDTITRSTCMTPAYGITNQYRHRTVPVYCKKTTPESRFVSDQGLHGPCPNSSFCCRCQHHFLKKESECNCHIGEQRSLCDTCKGKQTRQGEKTHERECVSGQRPFIYGDDAITDVNYGEKQSVPHATKATQASPSKVSLSPHVSELDIVSENQNGSSSDNNENSHTKQATAPEKLSQASVQKGNIELEVKDTTPNITQHKGNIFTKDKQNDNDMTLQVIDQNDGINAPMTISKDSKTDQPKQDTGNTVKNKTRTRKPVRSRYAFDRMSGTLPNYKRSDESTDVDNEREESTTRYIRNVSSTGAPGIKTSKRKNQQKKWEPPRWN